MTFRKPTLTIFQKMLAAPLVGLLFYSAYLLYFYSEQMTNEEEVGQIRAAYLPVLSLAGENVLLLDTLSSQFKDAVLAGEVEWVRNTHQARQRIDGNLGALAAYESIVQPQEVERLKIELGQYYKNASELAMAMLQPPGEAETVNTLIDNVEHYQGLVSTDFGSFRADLRNDFSSRIDEINHRMRQQVVIAVTFGLLLVVVVIVITFMMSLSTRRSLRAVNLALKNFATETPDFSRRLKLESRDELGELVTWFNQLADKLEKDHKHIEQLSITDKLTQLHNRTKIDELFKMELNKARRYQSDLSVILIDLDHFKQVNDVHGHATGDIVLQELAEVLRREVRDTDHLGRWGGEEFIVLSPNTGLEGGLQLAEKLRAAVSSFVFTQVMHKTGSFGVAAYHAGDDELTMLARADECLYQAKEQGRDRVVGEMLASSL